MVQETWLNTHQGRIFVKSWGDESPNQMPPIILFHDSLGCVTLWRDFPEQLATATGRRVIAYDRLGFGQSDPYPEKLNHRFIRDEAEGSFSAMREHFGIDRFVAFGHSVGGAMAVVCAGKFPAHCQGLITESAQAFVEEHTIEGILKAQQLFGQDGQLERLEKYHGNKAQWVLDAWINTWLQPDFSNWTLDEELSLVHCPTLVIHGAADEYGSAQHPERIAALTRGPSTLHLLPDCGHVPHREKQDVILQAVKAFLAPPEPYVQKDMQLQAE